MLRVATLTGSRWHRAVYVALPLGNDIEKAPAVDVTLPGYGSDVAANRAEARTLMEKHGYGPDQESRVAASTGR